MNETTRRRPIRHHAAALFVLAALGAVVPATARAGCGDHALPRIDPLADATLTNLGIWAGMAPAAAEHPQVPPTPRPPCAGMSCSEAPNLPMVPAPNGSVRADPWACLSTPGVSDPEPSDAIADERPGRPVHCGSPLDRPPRVAPSHRP